MAQMGVPTISPAAILNKTLIIEHRRNVTDIALLNGQAPKQTLEKDAIA
jgi:hypothetical protein